MTCKILSETASLKKLSLVYLLVPFVHETLPAAMLISLEESNSKNILCYLQFFKNLLILLSSFRIYCNTSEF